MQPATESHDNVDAAARGSSRCVRYTDNGLGSLQNPRLPTRKEIVMVGLGPGSIQGHIRMGMDL